MIRSDRGSIFLETVIATAIIAMILGAAYEAIGDSVKRARRVEHEQLSMLTARSQLAAVGTVVPLTPGITRGVDGTRAWSIEVRPYAGVRQQSNAGVPMLVTVSVTAGDSHASPVTLRSLRLTRSIG